VCVRMTALAPVGWMDLPFCLGLLPGLGGMGLDGCLEAPGIIAVRAGTVGYFCNSGNFR